MSHELSFLKGGPSVPVDCRVSIPEFDGPLDLLLHLIKNHEMDILNLQVAKITQQYLLYLDYMREMNLDMASEYLVMAATLTYLKSQVILPQEPENEATGKDPKAALIRRLVELKSYKELSVQLASRPRLFRDVFLCQNTGAEEILEGLEPEVEMSNPFQLSEAFKKLIERRRGVVHKVVNDEVPLAQCVEALVRTLKERERVTFTEMLPGMPKVQEVISMFLAGLELTKLQMTYLEQQGCFGPIWIGRKAEPEILDRAQDAIRGLSWQ